MRSQYIQANAAIAVYVWMINTCGKRNLKDWENLANHVREEYVVYKIETLGGLKG